MREVGKVLQYVTLILVLTALMMGCASPGGQLTMIPLTPIAFQPEASQSDYIVQVGDTLNIKFYYHPDHDLRDLVVRPDGKLLLPLVGDMQAAGLTPGATRREHCSTLCLDPERAQSRRRRQDGKHRSGLCWRRGAAPWDHQAKAEDERSPGHR